MLKKYLLSPNRDTFSPFEVHIGFLKRLGSKFGFRYQSCATNHHRRVQGGAIYAHALKSFKEKPHTKSRTVLKC